LFRLIWDLMFATDEASELLVIGTFGVQSEASVTMLGGGRDRQR
jgi:hypothetical protein